MSKSEFDVGIMGGGPAGSTAAILLAQKGFNVCLIEKKCFPRETLCGEFLSHEVIQFLKEQNIFDDFLSLNPNPLAAFKFYNNNGKSIYADFDFTAYGLRRSKFDNFLLNKAKANGAKIIQPAEVKNIKKINDNYELTISSGEGEDYLIKVNNLIAAYGKQNNLDKSLGRSFVNVKSKLNGIKFHIEKKLLNDFDEEEIQIYSSDKIYCGINAVDANIVTLCFLENRSDDQPAPRQQLPELMLKNKSFAKIFKPEAFDFFDEAKIYGTGNIYFGKRNLVENGIYMIGDAASVIAPLAGDGIGMAMESGKIISSLLKRQRQENLNKKTIEELYKKKWRQKFAGRIKTAGLVQKIILNKAPRFLGFELVYNIPSLLSVLIKMTRN